MARNELKRSRLPDRHRFATSSTIKVDLIVVVRRAEIWRPVNREERAASGPKLGSELGTLTSPNPRRSLILLSGRCVMFGSLGAPELLVIFLVALIVFGPSKLPELGKSLGEAIRGFKKSVTDSEKTPLDDSASQSKPGDNKVP
jgi:sec-independent protein translocase protein TatA